MRTQRTLTIVAAVLILATGAFAAYSIYLLSQGRSVGGSVISDASITIGGPFTLTDHTGKRVTEADYAGRAHLVFFGFTYCPDICPTKLAETTAVLDGLGSDADKIDVLFITIDPERDTPQALADYVSVFHPRIIGLTGSQEEITSVARAYRAFFRRVPLDGGDYTMDHSTVVYLFDKAGDFVGPVAMDRDPAEVAEELRAHL